MGIEDKGDVTTGPGVCEQAGDRVLNQLKLCRPLPLFTAEKIDILK